ncbi:hypothetical protein [Castellaniella caeni]|uniref:hypothetical protein n=1 Tax=Castellaniella caeni TaxID=266123 RepID=UPI00082A9EC5|nr:hypothetical protein [Castellaniella caeni]
MTILQRVWKATEVDREGMIDFLAEGDLGVILFGLGIIVLPIVAVLSFGYAAVTEAIYHSKQWGDLFRSIGRTTTGLAQNPLTLR